jgi:formate dehydrogenase subunit gamma
MSGGAIVQPQSKTAVAEERVVRYTFQERVIHWINGISYGYLLFTGLAIFTPYLAWMGTVMGGGGTIRYWHPWIGLVYMATIIQMQRMWRSDMVTTDADRQWSKNIEHYVKNEDDQMPPVGRFNHGQKQFFWVMFYCVFILLVTGIVMWIPERIPRSFHWVLPIMVFIHSAVALVTIAAFMIHVYMSIWVTPGSMKGMVEGTVSSAWAKTHHRLWWQRITGRKN